MELSEIRNKIDAIDKPLLELFLQRMELSKEVAEYKMANNIPVLNKKREREILEKVMAESGDLEQYAHRFYSTVFELSRSYQESMLPGGTKIRAEVEKALADEATAFPETGTIACQGVEGAYSQMAADRMFPRGNLVFFKTFEAVFDAVESGMCQFGVVPIENSSNGSVRATYDLLRKKNCHIVRSERLCIRHELLAKPGTSLADVREIHSHEQALGQCSDFLKSLGDKVDIIPADNTAMAAEMAANTTESGIAAIASHSGCDIYGLVPVATGIQNSDNNYTRFVCVAKDTAIYPGANHISLILALNHRPGALYEILSKLAALEINIIKLESCPIVGHDFEFMFFFELQGSVKDAKTLTLLESLERDCEGFVFLGNYLEV